MPTYEYKCRACGNRLEVVQSFTDAALKKCPECKGELGKVFGNIGIAFKGSGFYRNDSRSSSSSVKRSDGSKSESAGKGESTKSENGSKPDAVKSESGSSSKSDSSGSNGSGKADKPSGDSKPKAPAKT